MNNFNWSFTVFLSLLLFIYGTVVFFNGFFPIHYPVNIKNYVLNDSTARLIDLNELKLKKPVRKYNRTIIVVIDALRYDFVSKITMPITYNSACFIVGLRADLPTVTMPRIKSLMTGTLSNFVDVIFNLGHSKQLDDSLIHRLKNRGDVLVFAGDQTWQMLFPNEFQRITANTDSFFVNDFNEGDNNVTRVLQEELHQRDWNLMILHYLGLDHIGHVEGTSSLKIPSKLFEMDNIIKLIISNKIFDETLVLLTADHGMRNGGGHGGSTWQELHVPLCFFRKNCKNFKTGDVIYNQMDLAPTLAILMSTEIPKASIGSLIPEMLEELSFEEQLSAYYFNTLHLINKTIEKFGIEISSKSLYFSSFEDAKIVHKQFLKSKSFATTLNRIYFENAKVKYIYASRKISEILSSSLVKYNYKLVIFGLLLTSFTWICIIISTLFLKIVSQHPSSNSKWLMTSFCSVLGCFLCLYIFHSSGESIINWKNGIKVLIFLSCIYLLKGLRNAGFRFISEIQGVNQYLLPLSKAFLITFGFYIISQTSSSFIEKEHYSWYYLGCTILLIFVIKICYQNIELIENKNVNLRALIQEMYKLRNPILIIIIQILLKKINKAGKWNGMDFADVLNKSENKIWLSIFCILAFLCVLRHLHDKNYTVLISGPRIALLCIYCFHGLEGKLTFFCINKDIVQVVLAGFSLTIVIILIHRRKESKKAFFEKFRHAILLISCILQKPHNLILVPFLLLTLNETFKMCDQLKIEKFNTCKNSNVLIMKTLFTIFITKMFYFYQGNSNSLATIDLTPGFIGQSNYNPFLGVIFITLNTYCAHFNGFLFFIYHIIKNSHEISRVKELNFVIGLYITLSLLPVFIYFWLMMFFRHHLFIYSVFAPKLLYESFSVIVLFLNVFITLF